LAPEKLVGKEAVAEEIVHSYLGWSAGAGFIPIPLVDVAAIATVELKMLDSLAKLYDVPFKRDAAKSIIGALAGGFGTGALAPLAASLVKIIPIVGPLAGALTEPAVAAAATYALGRVFIQHFESGGTFLDFNPEAVRDHYRREFNAAKAA
jgi:uncharacterized protein (DUF697 family)